MMMRWRLDGGMYIAMLIPHYSCRQSYFCRESPQSVLLPQWAETEQQCTCAVRLSPCQPAPHNPIVRHSYHLYHMAATCVKFRRMTPLDLKLSDTEGKVSTVGAVLEQLALGANPSSTTSITLLTSSMLQFKGFVLELDTEKRWQP